MSDEFAPQCREIRIEAFEELVDLALAVRSTVLELIYEPAQDDHSP
jgi:hypothetical protein